PNIVTLNVPLCNGASADLNDGIDASSDPNTATFFPTSADAYAGTNAISNVVTSAGTYWVRAAMPGQPDCITVKKIFVTLVTITYTSNVIDATCLDPNGEITLSAADGAPPYSYTVDDGGSYNQTNTNGHFTGLHQGGYSITITDDGGCQIVDVIAVDNSGAPYFNGVNLSSPSCNGFCDGQIEVNVIGGNLPYTYIVSNANGDTLENFTGNAQDIIENLCAGNYLIDVTDNTGCKAVKDTIIIETPAVDSNFTFNDFCKGTTNGPTNIGTPGGTFSFNPTPSDGAIINSTTGEISNETIGTTYTVEYNTGGACPETENRDVTVNGFLLSATGTDANCEHSDGSINVVLNGGLAPYSYTFTNGGTSSSGSLSQSTQLIDFIPSGNYQISIQDNNGCTADTTILLNDIPGPTVSAGNDTIVCLGGNVILSASSPNQVHIVWSNGYQNGDTIAPTSPGIYDYYVIASDTATNCSANDTMTLIVNPLPIPAFKVDSTLSGCSPLSVQFIDTTGIPHNSCIWDFGDGETSSLCDTVPHVFLDSGLYTISLTLEDTLGCVGTTTKTDYIEVFGHPIADFTADPMVTDYDNTQVIFTDNSSNAVAYYWVFSDDSTGVTDKNPVHTFPEHKTGNYTVTLTVYDQNGCTDQHQEVIQIIHPDMKYKLPNIFTPNGDGENDFFKFVYQEGISEIKLVILNRWGNPIFNSNKINFKWNGQKQNNGSECVDGVYFYKITIKNYLGKEAKEFGYVHLVRGK
ncbi:MAG TPA: PKD domain-containing protein, partial [Ignavibacteriaceae bacterium]